MKTVKTLHFDAINTMYISALRMYRVPELGRVFHGSGYLLLPSFVLAKRE